MAKELFWGSLVENSDGEMHVVRNLDLEGTVLTLNDFLFRDICDGWLDAATSLTLLRLQSFRDSFHG